VSSFKKNKKVHPFPELSITPEQEEKVRSMIEESRQEVPPYWEKGVTESFYVPVDDGEIRVFHWKPENPVSIRPVVFIPGWGVVPRNYDDYFEVMYNKVECFYIETREKGSSRIDRKKARLDLHQKAKDIADALHYLGLEGEKDFVLMAPCWGAAILMQGMYNKIISAPTIVAVDPMHTLWFPKWILSYVGPWLPSFLAGMLKPIFGKILLGDMEEPVQKKRATELLDQAVVWKWHHSAVQVRNYELYDIIHEIKNEVIVVNGTTDKIHDQNDYPRLARLLPNSKFIYMKTGEENRERLMGVVGLEFSKVTAEDGIPPSLQEFERELQRAADE